MAGERQDSEPTLNHDIQNDPVLTQQQLLERLMENADDNGNVTLTVQEIRQLQESQQELQCMLQMSQQTQQAMLVMHQQNLASQERREQLQVAAEANRAREETKRRKHAEEQTTIRRKHAEEQTTIRRRVEAEQETRRHQATLDAGQATLAIVLQAQQQDTERIMGVVQESNASVRSELHRLTQSLRAAGLIPNQAQIDEFAAN